MLFNSYAFLFVFLPLVLIGFFLIGRIERRFAIVWLGVASIAFYGIWSARHVALLVGSIVFNYVAGLMILSTRRTGRHRLATLLTATAIAIDLAILGFYKYSGFIVANVAELRGVPPLAWDVILPIGISFYTFTQIAFLADAYSGKVKRAGFAEYFLFVSYFPHLIAGPILHHAEMISQFLREQTIRFSSRNMSIGLAVLTAGLVKKVLIADSLAPYADAVFAAKGDLPAVEAWIGALAYTLQLYFDFSGYCDMAVGISRMFNIDLPLNFYAPYKATSIIEFWRRWHMTLSRFLRDYLYIPLGGNRRGPARRYVNLMITMVLGGLWHGAAWTFVIWGALHGFYLLVNHVFRSARKVLSLPTLPFGGVLGAALTFVCVVVAWVFFRAESVAAAIRLLKGMSGFHGIMAPSGFAVPLLATEARHAVAWIAAGLLIVWLLPNTQQVFRLPFVPRVAEADVAGSRPTLDHFLWWQRWLAWRPSTSTAVVYGVAAAVAVLLFTRTTRFLYFQF